MAKTQNPAPEGNAADTSSTTSTTSTISQLRDEVASTLSSADTSAAQSVQQLQTVRQARLAGLSRTAAILTARYGPGSTEAQNAQAAVAAETTTVARVAIMNQQLTTRVPQVSKTGWMLHGRVFDAQLQPVAAFTVFLVDGQKTYQQCYGFAYTDQTGYFLIRFEGSDTTSQPKGKAQTEAPQLFLEIANTKTLPVYLSTTPFQPALGSITYQSVTLPAGDQPIGDPPAAIRKVALPGKTG